MCSECNVELKIMYNVKCIIIIILQPVVFMNYFIMNVLNLLMWHQALACIIIIIIKYLV